MPGALVMCDGGPASLKAIHYAGLPGNLLRRRALNEQLVILHAYDKPTTPAANATQQTTTTTGNNNMLDSVSNKPSTPHPGSYDTAEATTTAAADGTSGLTARERMPVATVVQTVIQTIQEDKPLRDSLLYTLETTVLPPPEPDGKGNTTTTGKANSTDVSAKSSARTASAGRPPRSSSQGRGAAHAAGATRLNATSSAAHTNTTGTANTATADETEEGKAEQTGELVPYRVQSLIAHVKARALHHNVPVVLLGVGPEKAADGKTLRLGSVARHALRQLTSHGLVLYCMKADGATLRLSTAQVRLVVLVQVGPAYIEEPRTTASSVKDGNGNNGALEQSRTSLVREMSQASSLLERTQAGGATTNNNNGSTHTTVSSVKSATATMESVDYLAAGEAAVQYALSCRRPHSKDCVSVVLVAEQQVSEAELQSYRDHFASLIQNSRSSEEEEPNCDNERKGVEDGASERKGPEQDEMSEAATTTAGGNVTEGLTSNNAASSNWPPLSVCQLKATKHIAHATLANSVTQVHKFLQQHKSDFYVFADCTTSPLQQALLTSVKPHCIVVPRPRKPCRDY